MHLADLWGSGKWAFGGAVVLLVMAAAAAGNDGPSTTQGDGGGALAATTAGVGASVPASRAALTPKGIEGVGLTAAQVNAGIDRGADFLWNYLKTVDLAKPNAQLGDDQPEILACLALVHAGAQKRYPDFDAKLREFLAKAKVHQYTYTDALTSMLVEDYGDNRSRWLLRQETRYLIESQGPKGTWGYGCKVAESAYNDPNDGKVLQVEGGIPLLSGTDTGVVWDRITPAKDGEDGDTSNTQYALLGLNAASRGGIRAPAELWKNAMAAHRARQRDDGSFIYSEGGDGTATMTCAGVTALALCRHELGEKAYADDPGIARGLQWLGANFSVSNVPQGTNQWFYYYMYSLERVGRILETEFIGDHEWYPLGAKQLISTQNADGSWVGLRDESDPRLATSFALLFLTRATASLDAQPPRGGEGTLETSALAPPPERLFVILDASGSMLDEVGGKEKFDIAREAVGNLASALPEDSVVGLRVYGNTKRAIEKGADEDTTLLIPMGKLDKKQFAAALVPLRARGKTPLALSLQDAIADMGPVGDEPLTLLLLTDGGEDTMPRRDPVKVCDQLPALKNVHLQIVAFDVAGRDDWIAQLKAMAAHGGGDYLPAVKGEDLNQQVLAAVMPQAGAFVVLDMGGKVAGQGRFGDSLKLHEGQYQLQTALNGTSFVETFWVNTDRTTSVVIDPANLHAARVSGVQVTTQPVSQTMGTSAPASRP